MYGLQQLITEPTRMTQTSATLIDLIYTNCPDTIVCSGVPHISISDHSIVFAYRKLSLNVFSRGHKAFEMILRPNIGVIYTTPLTPMICG